MPESEADRDVRYFNLIAAALTVSAQYKPKFGQSGNDGLTVQQFLDLYKRDRFYDAIGIASAEMYAAHKAAGGITSIYRQIGKGSERLFRQVLMDQLGLNAEQTIWRYEKLGARGKSRVLELDGRIVLDDIAHEDRRAAFSDWLDTAIESTGPEDEEIVGAVFEVRQGYKSADAKRQNADVENADAAYTHGYIPCVALLSEQINYAVKARYQESGWILLTGQMEGGPHQSLWTFCIDVLDYDLAAFFERKSDDFRTLVEATAASLLSPS